MKIERKVWVGLWASAICATATATTGIVRHASQRTSIQAERFPAAASNELDIKEDLRDEQRRRKIEVCGEKWLFEDSATNFDDVRTGWFPGRAKVLADPHEALLAKLLLIERAKKTIDISTYIFVDDESSRAMLDALRGAILRGVNVRFLVDAGGSLGEALKDQYRHLRTLLLARKIGEEVHANQGAPGTVDVVIFHPIGRIRSFSGKMKEILGDLFAHVNASSETSLNFDRRSHDKIFMIDRDDRQNAVAIVGGRNFDNSYYGFPQVDEKTYEDMELIVMNDASSRDSRTLESTLGQHFQNLFCSRGNRWLSLQRVSKYLDGTEFRYLGDVPSRLAFEDIMGARDSLLRSGEFSRLYSKMRGRSGADFLNGLARSRIMAGNEIQNLRRPLEDAVVDPNAPYIERKMNGNSIYYQIRDMIAGADKSIDVCTPYIFIPENERECLKHWVSSKPGRRIRILSNSTATSDSALAMSTFDHESAPEVVKSGHFHCVHPITHKVYDGEFDNRDGKIQVYELGRLDNRMFTKGEVRDSKGNPVRPSAFYGKLHAKFGIVDGRYSFVGSHNLDQRSRRLNSETAFFVDSEDVAQDLTGEFEKMLVRSYEYGDPDLEIMNQRPELRIRRAEMSAVAYINKRFPQAGFAN